MQLTISFTTLLATALLVFTAQDVAAAPTMKRSTNMVKLPLKRLEQRGDIHPQVLLQQNINRSHRRLARMTGRAEPSHEQLRSNLHKRLLSVSETEGQLSKRFYRKNKATGVATFAAGNIIEASTAAADKQLKGGKGAKAGAAAAAAAGGAGAAAAVPAAGTSAGDASNTDLDGTGVSPLDIAALANPGVTTANTPTDSDTLGLNIEGADVGYLATVQMGTPPVDYTILMDSGSADLWVGSETCVSEAGGGCGTHTFLGTSSSSTFVDTGKPFAVTYGTGDVKGDIVTDNVAIAGLALNAHTFGVANTESVQFADDSVPFDGLMGLAQSTLSEQQTLTPIESLAAANLVAAPIMGFKIPRLADNLNDGEITFGGLDTAAFDGSTLIDIPNVSTTGFWEGAMDAVSVDGNDLGLQGRTAILDTGTTLIVAPPADAATVHAAIPGAKNDGQGGFTVPCTTSASVALTFGGTSFAIDSRDIAVQPVDATDPTGDCVSGISSGEIGAATEWLVGDVFLKNAYFSTNVAANTVSLAKLV
jgi:hypothetical protein